MEKRQFPFVLHFVGSFPCFEAIYVAFAVFRIYLNIGFRMSSHSQFKKFNILQELEQAIKKKTTEKYQHRSKSRNKYPLSHSDPQTTSSDLSRSSRRLGTGPMRGRSPQEAARPIKYLISSKHSPHSESKNSKIKSLIRSCP